MKGHSWGSLARGGHWQARRSEALGKVEQAAVAILVRERNQTVQVRMSACSPPKGGLPRGEAQVSAAGAQRVRRSTLQGAGKEGSDGENGSNHKSTQFTWLCVLSRLLSAARYPHGG